MRLGAVMLANCDDLLVQQTGVAQCLLAILVCARGGVGAGRSIETEDDGAYGEGV